MTKIKNDINMFHPDVLDTENMDIKKYFQEHPSAKEYRENFPDFDGGEKEVYFFIKDTLFNAFEAMWGYVENNKEKENNKSEVTQSIHENFYYLKKLHIVEEDFLSHLELSLILWIYGKEEKEDVTRLQEILDKKLIPKTDPQKNKLKVSSFVKSISANLACFMVEKNISTRQSALLSSEFFGVSHSLINKLIPDIREVHKSGNLNELMPVEDIAKSLIPMLIAERANSIQRIVDGYQEEKINKSKREHFNKAYEAFIDILKENSTYFLNSLNDNEVELINKRLDQFIDNDMVKNINSIKIDEKDNLIYIITKSALASRVWLMKLYAPQALEDILVDK